MTWRDFCQHATSGEDREGRRPKGFQIYPFDERRLLERPDEAAKWLRGAPKKKREWSQGGYRGKTVGEWFLAESAGFYILQYEQHLEVPYRSLDDSKDAEIALLRSQGFGEGTIARKMQECVTFIRRRMIALKLSGTPPPRTDPPLRCGHCGKEWYQRLPSRPKKCNRCQRPMEYL